MLIMKQFNSDLINLLLGVVVSLFISMFLLFMDISLLRNLSSVVCAILGFVVCSFSIYAGSRALEGRRSYEDECDKIYKDEKIPMEKKESTIKGTIKVINAFDDFKKKFYLFGGCVLFSFFFFGISKFSDSVNKESDNMKSRSIQRAANDSIYSTLKEMIMDLEQKNEDMCMSLIQLKVQCDSLISIIDYNNERLKAIK